MRDHFPVIRRNGRFDLSNVFPGSSRASALNVHLYFVKLFGCKVIDDRAPSDVASLSAALMFGAPHPEISLQISAAPDANIVMAESNVYKMWNERRELHGAHWMYVAPPVAVKVCYIKAGAPLFCAGSQWHPSKGGKTIKLSPYTSEIQPHYGRAARFQVKHST